MPGQRFAIDRNILPNEGPAVYPGELVLRLNFLAITHLSKQLGNCQCYCEHLMYRYVVCLRNLTITQTFKIIVVHIDQQGKSTGKCLK